MLYLPPQDDDLATLARAVIPSDAQPGVTYSVEGVLGGGGMSLAFSAMRAAPDGQSRVVLKILRPVVAREAGATAALIVRKEAVSLIRLNERVPPTPFVVRLIDIGTLPVHDGTRQLELPWLALEHVHGGAEGTTLFERVHTSLRETSAAFDPERAAGAVTCLAGGLSAIHDVGVVHRDFKPANVLACGFGATEVFKIADFGIARPGGMKATFGGIAVGTPGYAAPEQLALEEDRLGPWSDVFSFAAVIYFMLTGEEYFRADTAAAALLAARSPERKKLGKARALSPDLVARPAACASLDAALARATAPNPDHRPQSAEVLAAMVLPALRITAGRGKGAARRAKSLAVSPSTLGGGFAWTVRHWPGDDRAVRSVAWDSDGGCLAATSRGLAFWGGTAWQAPTIAGLPERTQIHFVRRVDAGEWLLGGDGATLWSYEGGELSLLLSGRDPAVRFVMAGGDIDDLAVLVGVREGEPPMLHPVAARHWVKPAALTRAASITSIAQLDAERWLVTGRATSAEGFAVVYTPLEWEVKRVRTPATRAYLAAATRPELGLGIAAGTEGRVIRFHGDATTEVTLEGAPDIAAVALDPEGRVWAATLGRIWTMAPDKTGAFRPAWTDPRWEVPFVSLFADIGRVIAMTADGGILEGRFEGA